MKKTFLIFALILACLYKVNAQQNGLFAMYWNNTSYYNPAETGVNYKFDTYYLHRQQWLNFPGNPVTHQLAYNMRLSKINSGIGINYTHLKLGFQTNQYANINYAYHIKLSDENVLSFGLSGGFYSQKLDADWVTPDGTPAVNDPSISSNNTQTRLNLKSGIYFKNEKLQVGIAANNLTASKSNNLNYSNQIHLVTTGSYAFSITNNLNITPSTFVNTNFNSVQLNISLLAEYKKTYWFGAGHRISSFISLFGGITILEKFKLGYAYDWTTSQLQNFSNGSHEIVFAFQLK